jgi:heme exporter protein C
MKRVPKPLIVLDFLAAASITSAFLLVLFYAPVELEMGVVQKVFYFHVASTWTGMLGFAVATIAAALHLKSGKMQWDIAAVSGIEIGMVFVGIGIISGSIWAKPIWNTWWTWDPRLTTTLIMELIYCAYLILRVSVDDPTLRARYASIYAIIGFVSVPLTFLSIRIFRTIHPVVFGGTDTSSGSLALTSRMQTTFIFSLVAFTLFFIVLFWHRFHLGKLQSELTDMQISTDSED